MPYIDHIAGVGIARGIPNWRGTRSSHSSFAAIFAKCAAMGLKLTAHAGKHVSTSTRSNIQSLETGKCHWNFRPSWLCRVLLLDYLEPRSCAVRD